MKAYLFAFCLWALPCLCAKANEPGSRKRTIDILQVSLDISIDLEMQQVSGRATIVLSPLVTLKKIGLDAAKLDIQQVVDRNGKTINFQNEGSEKDEALTIEFRDSIFSGHLITLDIFYTTKSVNLSDPKNTSGSFGKGIRFLKPSTAVPTRKWQAWTIGLPHSNRYWFPGYDDLGDSFEFELIARCQSRFTVISNGKLIDHKALQAGSSIYHWKTEYPIFNHQVAIAVGEYTDIKTRVNDTETHNYSYKDEVEATIASTNRLADMISFFSSYTGSAFPYPSYSQVFVQDAPWGGAHHSSFSTISENMIDDAGTHADFLYLWDAVEGNDLAAQWFGNIITPVSWDHAWLNKSFANYFSALYNEYKNGEDEVQLWVRSFNQATIINDWLNKIRRPLVSQNQVDELTLVTDNYSSIYGSEVLHMLRKQVGESNWKKIIQQYVRVYARRQAGTEDFYQIVEKICGKPMYWFFDQWIYRMGHPVFEVAKTYNHKSRQLQIHFKQTQQPDTETVFAQAALFRGYMEIEIDQKIHRLWIPAVRDTQFSINLIAKPKFVNIDFKRQWIKEINYIQPLQELLEQAAGSKDILARNEAIQLITSTYQNDSLASATKESILQLLEKISTGNSYWRIRMAALNSWRTVVAGKITPSLAKTIQTIIEKDSSWLRASAIAFLGDSRNPEYFQYYKKFLADKSDRVINAAAIAIGKSKHPEAFNTLVSLRSHPSWKNQSLISCLNGLFQLGDLRGVDIALDALRDDPPKPRWTLANTTWDYHFTAVSTLAKLGKVKEGFDIVENRLNSSIKENSILDIFNNLQLMTMLGDSRAKSHFEALKWIFEKDKTAIEAIQQLENDFKNTIK